jgi:hypothetical protein
MMQHCRQRKAELATEQETEERRLGEMQLGEMQLGEMQFQDVRVGERQLGEQKQAVQLKLKFDMFEFQMVFERALGKLHRQVMHQLSTK